MKKKRYLPFGYQMEKGEIIPHPDEGPLVQAIFSKYLERAALSTLAKYASLSGIPYREGAGQWNKTMICRILDNSKYAGDEGFPPLVSKEQWEEAAFLRAAKAKQYGGSLPAEMKKSARRSAVETVSKSSSESICGQDTSCGNAQNAESAQTTYQTNYCCKA